MAITAGGVCPYLYHNMIPYRMTFEQGGCFRWRADRRSVEVLCPNPYGKVNILLRKEGNAKKRCQVLTIEGACCANYRAGQCFDMELPPGVCPLAFVTIFPVLLRYFREKIVDAVAICPSTRGQVKFQILKKSS